MFCKYCGTNISNDSNFCSKCGRNLFLEEGKSVISSTTSYEAANTVAASVQPSVKQVNNTAYNTLPQSGVYNNAAQSGMYGTVPQSGNVAYNNVPQSGNVVYGNTAQGYGSVAQNGRVAYNSLPGTTAMGINTMAAKRRVRPEVKVYDGFFFRHLDKKQEFLLKVGAAVIALWTAAAVVMIFFPQYSNLL